MWPSHSEARVTAWAAAGIWRKGGLLGPNPSLWNLKLLWANSVRIELNCRTPSYRCQSLFLAWESISTCWNQWSESLPTSSQTCPLFPSYSRLPVSVGLSLCVSPCSRFSNSKRNLPYSILPQSHCHLLLSPSWIQAKAFKLAVLSVSSFTYSLVHHNLVSILHILEYTPAELPKSYNLLSLSQDQSQTACATSSFVKRPAHEAVFSLAASDWFPCLSDCFLVCFPTCVRGTPSAPLNGVTSFMQVMCISFFLSDSQMPPWPWSLSVIFMPVTLL